MVIEGSHEEFQLLADEENGWSLLNIVDQVRGFEVSGDDGPPCAAPVAGRTFMFVIADGYGRDQLISIARVLERVLIGHPTIL